MGQKAFAVQCDVGQAEQVQTLADQAEQLLGHPVTLTINNAGVGLGGKFDEMSLEDWKWCMHVNLWCYSWLSCICAKVQKLGYGALINVACRVVYRSTRNECLQCNESGCFGIIRNPFSRAS